MWFVGFEGFVIWYSNMCSSNLYIKDISRKLSILLCRERTDQGQDIPSFTFNMTNRIFDKMITHGKPTKTKNALTGLDAKNFQGWKFKVKV